MEKKPKSCVQHASTLKIRAYRGMTFDGICDSSLCLAAIVARHFCMVG